MGHVYSLTDAVVWESDQVLTDATLVVSDGILTQLGKGITPVGEVISAAGNIILPLGVDIHVHMRFPGQPEKETPLTCLQAAQKGGIGAILTMPNTVPPIDSPELVNMLVSGTEEVASAAGVKVYTAACISRGLHGKESVDFADLIRAGARAFTDDGLGVDSDTVMTTAFVASCETGYPIMQHAEFCGHRGILAPGQVQKKLAVRSYPFQAETEMVKRDLRLLKKYPTARYHVLHVSSAETVDLIESAKEKEMNVTCEVTPHHLFFHAGDIDTRNSSFKMNPPLRSEHDRQRLQEGLRSGIIDFVASDHAPHEERLKRENFKNAAYGTIGLETSLKVLLSLVHNARLTPQKLVETFSSAPAKFLGIAKEGYGSMQIGLPARFCLFNPTISKQVIATGFSSKSTNSCFLDVELPGQIEMFVSGKIRKIF